MIYNIQGCYEMNKESKEININIFGKNFFIQSDEDEEYTREIAALLSNEMKEIAKQSGAEKFEKIAVIAALNIIDKYHKEKEKSSVIEEKLNSLLNKTENN